MSQKLRVLVVDDVAMYRDMACAFLSAAGHEATTADGGNEAVAEVISSCFDVVLMDVRMPEVDGLEATRRIRGLAGARANVAIIGLTAQSFAEQVAACREAGMDDHLAKPYTPDLLNQIVARAALLAQARAA
jgi:CheY-like chemotaxis protein